MTLNRLEVNNICEKTQSFIEISFRLQTRLSLLAMRMTFETNVKRFGYSPDNLAVYNTGQKQTCFLYTFQSLTNLEPE